MGKEETRQKFKNNVLLFGKVCMPGMFTQKTPLFHHEIAATYHDQSVTRTVVVAPRGHAKSSLIACLFVLHHIFFDEGKKFVVLVSKTEGHAERLLTTIKNVLDYSMPFRAFLGYHGQQVARVWKSTEIVLDTGDVILCRGTGQQVVGLKSGDQRPTFIVLDDPEDMNNTKTNEAMEFNLLWLLQSLLPARDAQRGRCIVVGTPQHQRCMVEILCKTEGWKVHRYKALNGPGALVETNKDLVALWPEQWSVAKLLEEKAMLDSMFRGSAFYREYQCEVTSDEAQLFKEEDFQYYKGTVEWDVNDNAYLAMQDDGGAVVERKPVNIFMGIDPATSTSENADFTVIMPIAIDAEKNRYILPYKHFRKTPSDVIDAIISERSRWKPLRTRLEVSGQQEIYASWLRQSDEAFRLVTHNPREKKEKRYLEGLQPYFAKKKVFITREMEDLKQEFLMYRPDGRHKHDDILDGIYYAFHNIYPPSHTIQVTKQGNAPVISESGGWLTA